jgi:nitric oxide reductase subunit C
VLTRALVLAALILGACGGGARSDAAPRAAAPVGDPARGKVVFTTAAAPACATCHVIEGVSEGRIGPDLSHLGTEADRRIADPAYKGRAHDAAGYIRESIVDPNAYIPPACPAGTCYRDVMPKDFAKKLTAQQLEDLIAYLLSQN